MADKVHISLQSLQTRNTTLPTGQEFDFKACIRYNAGMQEVWLLMESGPGDAAWNMAVDEALLLTAPDRRQALLRVYCWTRPSVSIGYFQKFPAHLAGHHDVVRRPTGGGLVYHGNDTTYTIVVPAGHWLHRLSTAEAYCAIHKAVAEALQSGGTEASPMPGRDVMLARAPRDGRSGASPVVAGRAYECFVNPVPGDIVDGNRKLGGAAQRRTRNGMLHQGSILEQMDVSRLTSGFADTMSVTFVGRALSAAEAHLAQKLAAEKYGQDTWNRRVT